MLKIITNYRKLFIKILKNDLEVFGGGKFGKIEKKNETFEEIAGEIIAGVKGKLEKLKISVGDFLIGNAVESEKSKLTIEQKKSAIGLKELIYGKLLTLGRRDYTKNQPTQVFGVRA